MLKFLENFKSSHGKILKLFKTKPQKGNPPFYILVTKKNSNYSKEQLKSFHEFKMWKFSFKSSFSCFKPFSRFCSFHSNFSTLSMDCFSSQLQVFLFRFRSSLLFHLILYSFQRKRRERKVNPLNHYSSFTVFFHPRCKGKLIFPHYFPSFLLIFK